MENQINNRIIFDPKKHDGRSSTRVISFYRGVTQVMPLFAILFFLLCLANCGAPLSLNFIGEFLSLYGVFER